MAANTAISIGNFDGVHLGHRRLLAAARSGAGPTGTVVAVTFDPHPAAVLRPGDAPAKLLTMPERLVQLREHGADEVIVLDATNAFLATSADEFIKQLHQRVPFALIVEGPGFRFGRGRRGSLESLAVLGSELGFRVEQVERVTVVLRDGSQVPASSSMARWLLALGRVEDAALVLGRRYELAGHVVRGDQRGRTIGFPTANIDHGDLLLPGDGIYAGCATLPDGSHRAAAVSVGTKPTFGRSERVCEAHLLEFDGWSEDYGWSLRLRFDAWVRGQFHFDSVPALVAQMQRDVDRTRHFSQQPEGAPA